MVRRKRMGAYNALDDLLPGPPAARPGAERTPHPAPGPPKRTTRPKRMGLYNALDDLLPGPGSGPEPTGLDWSSLDWGGPDRGGPDRGGAAPPAPSPPPARPGTTRARRSSSPEPFHDLLPGPPAPPARAAGAGGPETGTGARGTGTAGTGGTAIFDALDDLLPGPPAPAARPARVRASFSLPPDVLDALRDAAAHLSSGPGRMTLAELAEQALRTEVDRLADQHNRGRPFPRRPGR